MTRQEIIKALKENLAQFDKMDTECKDVAKSIGRKEFLYLTDNGDWRKTSLGFPSFVNSDRYRLRPDYRDEPQYVEYEICANNQSDIKWLYVNTLRVNLHKVVSFKNFSHFKDEKGQRICLELIATHIYNGGKVWAILRKE